MKAENQSDPENVAALPNVSSSPDARKMSTSNLRKIEMDAEKIVANAEEDVPSSNVHPVLTATNEIKMVVKLANVSVGLSLAKYFAGLVMNEIQEQTVLSAGAEIVQVKLNVISG
jgi:hypothetical protein